MHHCVLFVRRFDHVSEVSTKGLAIMDPCRPPRSSILWLGGTSVTIWIGRPIVGIDAGSCVTTVTTVAVITAITAVY